jgi:hypothetical protein
MNVLQKKILIAEQRVEIVLAPGLGDDISAAQAKAARRVLAWCDERTAA